MSKKVYIKKPSIDNSLIRTFFKKEKKRIKIADKMIEIDVSIFNDNGIFNLGMRFQNFINQHNKKEGE